MTLTRAQAKWDPSHEFTAKMLRIRRKWTRLTGPEKQAVRLLAPVIQRQTLCRVRLLPALCRGRRLSDAHHVAAAYLQRKWKRAEQKQRAAERRKAICRVWQHVWSWVRQCVPRLG